MADHLQQFVDRRIFARVLTLRAPKTINVKESYRDFLVQKGHTRLGAAERAEEILGDVQERIRESIEAWGALGLPSPVRFGPRENLLVSWAHDRHDEITGHRALPRRVLEVWEWIGGLTAEEFVLPVVAYVSLLGCDPVYVTDGPRDGGVDVIGRISYGPLRSVVVWVQAKTTTRTYVKANRIFEEYGKYAALYRQEQYQRYVSALAVDKQNDGSSGIYFMITNAEYSHEARVVAKSLDVVLRSRRQLAYWLGSRFSVEVLEELRSSAAVPFKKDLYRNLAPIFKAK